MNAKPFDRNGQCGNGSRGELTGVKRGRCWSHRTRGLASPSALRCKSRTRAGRCPFKVERPCGYTRTSREFERVPAFDRGVYRIGWRAIMVASIEFDVPGALKRVG